MQAERVSAEQVEADQALPPFRSVFTRFGLLLVVLLMMGILTLLQPQYFFTRENLTNITRQVSSNSVLALGEFVVIVTAGIDLSVGSVMGLAMTVVALAVHAGWFSVPALLAALATGLGVGMLNGLALTRLHLPHPFIATLATLNIARGATYLLSGGVPISGLPPAVRFFGAGEAQLFARTASAITFPSRS